ncbi:hypothetical protein EC957_010151 [Mortierella hygrophila]|uniref:Kazal-like domain-containing protein n=1 Tax=Mortierella hygrophila TaxID=979708 RepID=A0A9P6K4R9_9FUNG|nr:hypothetical protein EC957_010151 [Mortierella hygrophila]
MHFSSSFVSLTVLATLLAITSVNASPIPPSSPLHEESPCIMICPMNYSPICGINKGGQTIVFSNACMLDSYNYQNPTATFESVANAACSAVPSCPDACPTDYHPVCAKLEFGNSKTFSNECELKAFNCMNPKAAFIIFSEGAC